MQETKQIVFVVFTGSKYETVKTIMGKKPNDYKSEKQWNSLKQVIPKVITSLSTVTRKTDSQKSMLAAKLVTLFIMSEKTWYQQWKVQHFVLTERAEWDFPYEKEVYERVSLVYFF